MACDNMKEANAKLNRWIHFEDTNFTAQLFNLISKADSVNKEALQKGFPYGVKAYDNWMHGNVEGI